MKNKLTAVSPLSNFILELIFNANEVRLLDVKPYLTFGIFTELQNIDYFNKVTLFLDSIKWPNGQDFSPETLYIKSVIKEVEVI